MKLPKKLIIKKNESKEIQKIKKTLNDLLDFHYEFHNVDKDHCPQGEHRYGGGGC